MKALKLLVLMLLIISVSRAQQAAWLNTMGGSSAEAGGGITTDLSGNVFTVGYFSDIADFEPGPEITNITSNGGLDIFIQKTDMDGNFEWVRSIGGIEDDLTTAIAADELGNVYITGSFDQPIDFDPGPNTTQLTPVGEDDIFILKLNTHGDFVWVQQIGGANTENGAAITIGQNNVILIAGSFEGTVDFDPSSSGTFNLTSQNQDQFVLKLDSNGDFIWAQQTTTTESIGAANILEDFQGNYLISGGFFGTVDLDPGTGVDERTATGSSDIYLQKISEDGNYMWGKTMGGVDTDYATDIAIDGADNLYITGVFNGDADFDPTSNQLIKTSNGGRDVFVQKFDAFGNMLFVKVFGGTGNEDARAIDVTSTGKVITSGSFSDVVDFNPNSGEDEKTAEATDVFVHYLEENGEYLETVSFSGASFDFAFASCLNTEDSLNVTGNFFETIDVDPTGSIDPQTSSGFTDVYVVQLSNRILGIGTSEALYDVTIFPNPSSGLVTLSATKVYGSVHVQILNSLGQILKKYNFQQLTTTSLRLPESSGMYFCNISTEQGTRTIKLIKQ